MSDAFISPLTREYVFDTSIGAPQRDVAGGLGNAVFLRLMTQLGSYWADETLGSRLHEIQREKDLSRISVLAKQYAEQALAPILSDGRATQIVVQTDQPGDGRLYLLIEVFAVSGERLTFKHLVKVI